jgi:hypothetical protein
MPAMNALQLRNRRPNIAGAARSYGVIMRSFPSGAWERACHLILWRARHGLPIIFNNGHGHAV